jgi:hypothetical protein
MEVVVRGLVSSYPVVYLWRFLFYDIIKLELNKKYFSLNILILNIKQKL